MSYELRQTTILEAEIDVLREQLTRAKEENIELIRNYVDEFRNNERLRKGFNSNVGFDIYLDDNTTWSNAINLRNNNSNNPEYVTFNNYDINRVFTGTDQQHSQIRLAVHSV